MVLGIFIIIIFHITNRCYCLIQCWRVEVGCRRPALTMDSNPFPVFTVNLLLHTQIGNSQHGTSRRVQLWRSKNNSEPHHTEPSRPPVCYPVRAGAGRRKVNQSPCYFTASLPTAGWNSRHSERIGFKRFMISWVFLCDKRTSSYRDRESDG